MTEGWGSLPLLSLTCILDHLSLEDGLSTLSTCRHWRSAILLYEGHKDTLKLRARNLEKNLFLARIFRKHTRKLHVYIDNCGIDLENFMNFVLPQFFDTLQLRELEFIGPRYIINQNASIAKINRVIAEALIYKNAHCLNKLNLLGCEMVMKNEKDRYKHKSVEYYSRDLSYSTEPQPGDSFLTNANVAVMMFSTLTHIVFDYDLMNTATLETINQLSNLSLLTLNICSRRPPVFETIDWHHINQNIEVALNVILVTHAILDEIVDSVLVEGIPLVSFKALFCKTFHSRLLQRLIQLYKESLRELVWADAPHQSSDMCPRAVHQENDELAACNVNPLILLCWQCQQLQRLAIHGYWIWQYDIVGFVRLRRELRSLQVSAVYSRRGRRDSIVRVHASDIHRPPDAAMLKQVNTFTDFAWSPVPWERLHPALRARASPTQRASYVRAEARLPPPPPHASPHRS